MGGIKQYLWLHQQKEVPEKGSVDATTKVEEVAKLN